MAVKIMIKRKVASDKEADLLPLIIQLRTLATIQPGYISGETLRNVNNPEDYLVISTWQSVDDWENWKSGKERSEIQSKIDSLLGEKTEYEIYHYPEKSSVSLRGYRQWEGG
ncbi:MAG: antibiotic biosynthesis monooxygenase [Proteobacteria bacterium]|nr:antibiotic biosynthesis monooxygenase [Pseudomonadota bacterium]